MIASSWFYYKKICLYLNFTFLSKYKYKSTVNKIIRGPAKVQTLKNCINRTQLKTNNQNQIKLA